MTSAAFDPWETLARIRASSAAIPASPAIPSGNAHAGIAEIASSEPRSRETAVPRHDPGADAERAAIIGEAEAAYGPPDPPERHAAIMVGLLAASRPRIPPSWSDPAQHPQRGAVCACCRGTRWWGDANGWRCCTCYGPLSGTTPNIVET